MTYCIVDTSALLADDEGSKSCGWTWTTSKKPMISLVMSSSTETLNIFSHGIIRSISIRTLNSDSSYHHLVNIASISIFRQVLSSMYHHIIRIRYCKCAGSSTCFSKEESGVDDIFKLVQDTTSKEVVEARGKNFVVCSRWSAGGASMSVPRCRA
ncbi:hypothetical protein ACFE04_011380 [Oxalis oulophora]